MPRRRSTTPGFTLTELMIVVAMIMVLTFLAVPALKTFTARDKDAGVASFVVREMNRVKAQAQMRNRAYVVQFSDHNRNSPLGVFEIFEGRTESCADTLDDLANRATRIANYGFGTNQDPEERLFDALPGGTEPTVGLFGWVPPGADADAARDDMLVLCARPNGALVWADGAARDDLSGRILLRVQRFATGEGIAVGPPRRVRFDFAQPARLELQ